MGEGPRSASAGKVQAVLDGFGLGHTVVEFERPTRTAQEAADAIGCTVTQIAKSLIFRTRTSGRPVLVIASGVNRVDAAALSERFAGPLGGEELARADAGFVRDVTGFAIGGVPPVGHAVPPVVLIDKDLFGFETLWAAAGTPNAVFRLTPADLQRMTGGTVGDVT